jgi:DNA polymerase-3 subunit epsilon
MDLKKKFWIAGVGLLLLVLSLPLAGIVFLHLHLPPETWQALIQAGQDDFIWLFFPVFFIILVGLLLLGDIFQSTVLPLERLSDETALIAAVNPGHRVRLEGCREIQRLARCINDAAERLQSLQTSLGQQLQQVTGELEKEKQVLGAVIAELPQAVVVCNLQGEILLYNHQAKQIFPTAADGHQSRVLCGYLGLGRSIYNLLDPFLVDHALGDLRKRIEEGDRPLVFQFMARGAAEDLLKISMVTIRDHSRGMTGYVLVISDLARQMAIEQKIQNLLHWFIRASRDSAAGMCTAIDRLMSAPDASGTEMERQKSLICENMQLLSTELEEGLSSLPLAFKSQWPMQSVAVQEVFQIVRKEALEQIGMRIHLTGSIQHLRLRLELFSFMQALLFLLHLLRDEHAVEDVTCVAEVRSDLVHIDWLWRGEPVRAVVLEAWKQKTLGRREEGGLIDVQGVLDRHEAVIASERGYGGNSFLRFSMPQTVAQRSRENQARDALRAPEYDFSLLTAAPSETLGQIRLEAASYTVFDLETTGLDPRGGDEVVSISAVRIVNNRIIAGEVFDQLINPQRSVPAAATRIHGLTDEMLRGRPGLDEVLPLFYKFCEGTILVAHAADFDLAFLQKHEHSSGIRLSNPVLDTFKLSLLVHPSHKDHSLEALAGRLNVAITNRHSSLGDARAAAEILLHLLPLLKQQGLHTIQQVSALFRREGTAASSRG